MEVSVENTSTLGRKIKVSVPDETVNAQVEAKIKKLAKEAHLKGFRRGKVPPSVIQKEYGKSIKNEVVDELIRQSIGDFFNEKKIKPAGTPRIEEIKNHAGHLEFVATFDVYPEITLATMSDVEIKKRKVNISDEDVSKMIEKLQDQLGNWLPVDRQVVKGDKLSVDFARQLKSESTEEKQEQKNVTMVVGSEGVLPGLSEALIGKQKGDHLALDLRYPDDWADLPAAGKEVNLSVTINEINEKQPLNKEELTQKLNIEKDEILETKVRERMQHESEQVLKDELKEIVLEKLLEKNPIDLPQSLIDQEKVAIQRELAREQKAGHLAETFSLEDIEAQAKQRVELGLLLNEVIIKYALKADRQQVRTAIEKAAARFAKPAEIINAYYSNKELLYSVERMVLLEQAVETLLKEINVIEIDATFNEVMNPDETKESQAV